MKLLSQETKSTIRFSAKLFRPKATDEIGSWTLLTVPKNASAKLPSRGMTMVEGTINGFPFRAVDSVFVAETWRAVYPQSFHPWGKREWDTRKLAGNNAVISSSA
jgi:hypothetical protein